MCSLYSTTCGILLLLLDFICLFKFTMTEYFLSLAPLNSYTAYLLNSSVSCVPSLETLTYISMLAPYISVTASESLGAVS